MLIASLLLAAAAPSPMATAADTREAFAKCLRADLKKSLEAKKTAADYEAAIKTVCQAEREAFRKAVIVLDTSGGDSDADATEDADLQVEDYNANFIETFISYSESGPTPAELVGPAPGQAPTPLLGGITRVASWPTRRP